MEAMAAVMQKLQEKMSQYSVVELDGLEEPKYNCQLCKDKGGTFEKKTDEESGITSGNTYEIWIECSCSQVAKVNNLLKSSEITAEFKKLGFTNFELEGKEQVVKDAHACAQAYYMDYETIKETRNNSIALFGQPGAGKTHLLTAVSNNFIQKKLIPVLYFPYVEGFNDLRDDMDKLETKLRRMKEVEVLLIDDLFKPITVQTNKGPVKKPRATEWQIEQMYSVINYRYLNHKPIMVSSELDTDELIQIDEALATRIAEMCESYMVVINGDKKLLNHRIRNF